ncbi:Crp/Fnr family transcriptional regulator [Thermodesulfobacteriota bacterium]
MGVHILKNIPYFTELTIEEMQKLVASSQKQRYPRGSIVLNKDDVGDETYLIMTGKVKVIITHTDGKEIILNILKSGDFFGEMAVFDKMPRSATVVAEEDCELLIISRENIANQIKRNPQIAFKLLSDISRRLREADEQISGLAHLDAKGRVAQTLLKLSKEATMITNEGYQVFPKPPIKDIAAMSGTPHETVSRLLSELVNKGIIGLTEEHIIIYDKF